MTVFAISMFAEVTKRLSNFQNYYAERLEKWAVAEVGGTLKELTDGLRKERQRLEAEQARLLKGGLALRPPRRMPSMSKIAQFNDLGHVPHCVRCGFEPPVETWAEANSWLERAHVVDRVAGGLDNEANLRPLCSLCHQLQPAFCAGDEKMALAWFGSAGAW